MAVTRKRMESRIAAVKHGFEGCLKMRQTMVEERIVRIEMCMKSLVECH